MKGYGLRTGNALDKRLYEIWRKMHYRCENPKHKAYKNYGGRGITVCDEWNSLIVFGKWALENGYAENLTLDRIDNDGNYEPSNCQWATMKQQAQNKTKGHHISVTTKPVVLKEPLKVNRHSFSVRQRNKKWEYRIEGIKAEGKRKQISKCGFLTEEEAIIAAEEYIKQNYVSTDSPTKI